MEPNRWDLGWIWVAMIAAVFGSSTVSCGGETTEGGGSCDPVSGCGGDITGVWHLTALCAQVAPNFLSTLDAGVSFPSACDGAFGSPTTTPIDATITFTAGTYQEAGTARVSTVANWRRLSRGANIQTHAFCSAGCPVSTNSSTHILLERWQRLSCPLRASSPSTPRPYAEGGRHILPVSTRELRFKAGLVFRSERGISGGWTRR